MKGRRIAVLEARLGRQMVELIEKRGGIALHAPALAEVADVDPERIAALVRDLKARPADLAIFQTGVGTQALFKATDALGITEAFLAELERATVVVRGPKPTGALRTRAVRIDLSADDPFTTTEVLARLRDVALEGKRVVVQRYGAHNAELEEALEAKGAEVLEIPTYRWELPEDTQPIVDLIKALERREVDAVVFTNAAQVQNLFRVAEQRGLNAMLGERLGATVVASIGPVCTQELVRHGVAVSVEAHPPKLGPLMAALDGAFAR